MSNSEQVRRASSLQTGLGFWIFFSVVLPVAILLSLWWPIGFHGPFATKTSDEALRRTFEGGDALLLGGLVAIAAGGDLLHALFTHVERRWFTLFSSLILLVGGIIVMYWAGFWKAGTWAGTINVTRTPEEIANAVDTAWTTLYVLAIAVLASMFSKSVEVLLQMSDLRRAIRGGNN
jgi:hypothetical protein